MNLIQIENAGGPEVLKLVQGPKPEPQSKEVLIEVFAAGLNRPDIFQRQGSYPPPPGASPIPGLEVSGKIFACGSEIKRWKIGDSVCALLSGGGYAEYCVAPEEQCLPIPEGLSFEEAAAIPETFFTVWSNVFTRGRLVAGESFLVHGGTSGIGTTAIQLAHLLGAKVYATAGSDSKCQACLGLGADAAINYKTQDFVAELKKLSEGSGINLILDMVGGPYFEKNLEILAREGRLVQIAFLQGSKITADLKIIMIKSLTVTGSTLRARPIEQKGAISRELEEKVWPLFKDQKLKVRIDKTFPLADAAQAHAYMESGDHIGKIVLAIR